MTLNKVELLYNKNKNETPEKMKDTNTYELRMKDKLGHSIFSI